VDGRYFWDLFPGFVLGGAGIGLTIVPVTIAGLSGVQRADAGIASGLINTSRQIGGAIGLAAVSAIAITTSHTGGPSAAGTLDDGYRSGLYALLGLLVLGIGVSALLVRPAAAPAPAQTSNDLVLQEAA
jgi:hypothetical protein